MKTKFHYRVVHFAPGYDEETGSGDNYFQFRVDAEDFAEMCATKGRKVVIYFSEETAAKTY